MDKIKRKKIKRPAEQTGGMGLWILGTLLFMYVVTGLLLFLMAVLLYKFNLRENFVTIGIIFAYVLPGFLGGLMIRRGRKQNCAFFGLLIGSIYFLVLISGSALLNHGFSEELPKLLAVWIMCGCGGMAGAMIGREDKSRLVL